MFYAYIIKSLSTGKFYIGSTADIEKRLKRHNSGYTRSIAKNRPFQLIYNEEFKTREEAYRRERQIKSYKGGNAFKKLVQSQDDGVDNRTSL